MMLAHSFDGGYSPVNLVTILEGFLLPSPPIIKKTSLLT